MMTHESCQEQLLDLVYGELRAAEKAAVESRLGGCDACRGELEKIAGTRAVMRSLAPEPAPTHGEHLVLTAARHAAENAARPVPFLQPWVWKLSLSAALVAVVGGLSVKLIA